MSMDERDRLNLIKYRLAEAKLDQAIINEMYEEMKDFNTALEQHIRINSPIDEAGL